MSCCFWWFLLGALLGWLLNWFLCKWTCGCRKKDDTVTHSTPEPLASVTPTPAAEPVKAAVAEPAPAPKVEPVKAAAVAPAAAATFVLDKAAAKAAGFKIKGPNDLTVIEGIGPKINQLFNNAGYHTFAEVSKMSTDAMQKILDDAGPRYRLARPDTWAKQAELAAENKWAELKAWQDELDHGV